MKAPKVQTPKAAAPIPVAQPDDPTLIDSQRTFRRAAQDREGSSGSLLAGGSKGDTSDAKTRKKRLGAGALAY